MSPTQDAITKIIEGSPVAALAVVDDHGPAVSQVGFAVTRGPLRFHLLVSGLSAHTSTLAADPRCALLLSSRDEGPDLASPRLSVRGRATFVSREDAEALGITAAYRARHPMAETLLGLADFRFVTIEPVEGTLVLGFGRAFQLSGEDLETSRHVRPDK